MEKQVSLSPEAQKLLNKEDRSKIWVKRKSQEIAGIEMKQDLNKTEDCVQTDQNDNRANEDKVQPISYFALFRYSNCLDWFLFIIGTVFSLATGAATPILFAVFGDLTTQFTDFGVYSTCFFTYKLCAMQGVINLTEVEWNVTIINVVNNFESNSIDTCVKFVYVACTTFVGAMVYMACWSTLATRQIEKIRLKFFHSVLRQDMTFYDLLSAGKLNNRLNDNMTRIKQGIGDSMGMTLQFTGVLIGCIVVAFIRSWKITLVNLAGVPFLGIVASILFKVNTLYSEKELNAYAKAGSIAEEAFLAIRTVVAFGCQDKMIDRYSSNLHQAKVVGAKKRTLLGLSLGINRFIVFAMYAVSFWYGSILVIDGEIYVGDFVAAFFSVIFVAFSLGLIMKNIEYFTEATSAGAQVFSVIDRKSKIDVFCKDGVKPSEYESSVEVKNVTFKYPSRPKSDVNHTKIICIISFLLKRTDKVLRNVSFTIPAGKNVAIVGHSGCGKSTILKLIQRFYDIDDGVLSIGGHDVRSLNVRWLREQIGLVSQEPVLFNTTIAENIRWGREDVSDEELIDASKIANAYDFINTLPDKFDTIVGDRGTKMSGGQKQRISIARAVIRNPKILLLDEATSALDAENEALVQSALEKASQDRTTIIIAHRLSTIRGADKIIVLDGGEVKEGGRHEELMEVDDGIYRNLVSTQLIKDQEPALPNDLDISNGNGKINKKQAGDISLEDEQKEDEEDHDMLTDAPFKRLWMLSKPEWLFTAIGCFFAIIAGAGDPLLALVFGEVLKIFTTTNDQLHRARIYSLTMFGLGVSTFFWFWMKSVFLSKSGTGLTERLRKAAFRAILRQDLAFFDEPSNSSGTLSARLSSDAGKVDGCIGTRAGLLCQNFAAVGCAISIAFAFSWQMALLMLAVVPFVALGSMLDMFLITGHNKTQQNTQESAADLASQSIRNIQLVASLTKEAEIYRKYESMQNMSSRRDIKKGLLISVSYGYSQSVILFVFASVFRLGIHLVANGELEFERVFSIILACIFGAMALGQNSAFVPDYAEAKIAAARIIALLDRRPKIDIYSDEGLQPDFCKGAIALKSIKFKYPTRPNMTLLDQLNLTVESGQTLALIGQSGSGKSTTVQLIERFYDVDEGQLLIDGVDVKELNVNWHRQQIGVVTQEPTLFDDTIRANIKLGDCSRDVDDDEMRRVSKIANAHDFIQQLPQKYDTICGEDGSQLSGGQRQRIAIARALLRNPKILLLDEATSALDAESEKIVQAALDQATEGRTCIIIAHRLSTVMNADQIAVIDDGRVVETGTHDQLLALRGAYYRRILLCFAFRLVNAQLTSEEVMSD
ncbi:ATP-dependent translocase ABCB1-like isoform X3 [Clavelina lepadiformis]|uniref:ATP-dependent translocase ABCB1-like isoform X3 n=1 Tax=Clavelina lepadiformis TaxID=159417 RepID=UPI004042FFE4